MHQASSRARARSTSSALAEFHTFAGHAGPADGCPDCTGQLARQRQAASALRSHQRQTRQQVDTILDRVATP